MAMTRAQIEAWLLDYAWLGDPDEQRREVECILSQPGIEHLDALQEKYAGMVESPGDPAQVDDAYGFALSALYECHDGPHLDTCPRKATS